MPSIDVPSPPEVLKILAHDLRWTLIKALTISDYQVNELVDRVEQPINLVSYHLKQIRDYDLVTARRSEADGRDVYYSLNLERLRSTFLDAGMALHPSLAANLLIPAPRIEALDKRLRILFVCTHNSARSQMAEGILRHLGGASVEAFSAGRHPTTVRAEAIKAMDDFNIDIRSQQTNHLQDYAEQSFDYVITVCDMAREVCPSFPGDGQALHWGYADPTSVADPDERLKAFQKTAKLLYNRIQLFLMNLRHETDHTN
ncbi:MAG: ArsR family transcriptional regulator [Anaerolineae bacterium]|nr:ArsR family transcriptional regulator [Anaerolineae bacterium]